MKRVSIPRLTIRLPATAPGAGLGLSIVQAVARAHGDDVHAEPPEGGSLVVTVTLPGTLPGALPGKR